MSIFPNCRESLHSAILLLGLLAPGAWQADADEVVYLTRSDTEATARGTIIDYTGRELLLRAPSGREQAIETDRVLGIAAERTAQQSTGERLSAEGNFAAALEQFRAAIRNEPRRWMQRQILAEITVCYANLEQPESAASTFLVLHRDDPSNRFFEDIPLSWRPYQPAASFAGRSQAWMGEDNNPLAMLLGASWLLSTNQRGASIEKLKQLTEDDDPRIAFLARSQLWRTRLVMADAAEVGSWQRQIEASEAPLRGGPYFLLGKALARLNKPEEAALALMRVPILYPGNRQLTKESLNLAAAQLEKLGRTEQAKAVAREASEL